jgi:hypothetical protein
MKPILAILAHQAAQPTIDDFMPQWKRLPCDVVAFIPEGDTIQGFDAVHNIGISAYSGAQVFERFLLTCEALESMPYDRFIIAEYDTVNLSDELPPYIAGHMISNFVIADGINKNTGTQFCALSPWVMDRPTLRQFIEAGRKYAPEDGDAPSMGGLLDRWIGSVAKRSGMKTKWPYNMIGYPWHEGIHRRITNTGATWIHGFKTKEEFGELWTQAG